MAARQADASTFTLGQVKKTLFRSPSNVEEQASDDSEALMSRLQIEHDVESSLRGMQKELHEQRLKQLKLKLKRLSEDDWRYPPVEKLIGLK